MQKLIFILILSLLTANLFSQEKPMDTDRSIEAESSVITTHSVMIKGKKYPTKQQQARNLCGTKTGKPLRPFFTPITSEAMFRIAIADPCSFLLMAAPVPLQYGCISLIQVQKF